MSDQNKTSKKPLIIAAVIAILFLMFAFAGLYRIRSKQATALPMPDLPLAVKVVPAVAGNLKQSIPVLATVKSAATTQIKAEISGRIVKLPLREGDSFKKGDILAIIDGREQQAQLSAAKARSNMADGQIASIRANIKALESQRNGLHSNFSFLESELLRYEKLFNAQAISASAIDAHRNRRNDAESKLLSLDAQIQSQKAQITALESQKQASRKEVDLWQLRSDYSEIVAEFPGVISQRHQEESNLVMPGTPVLTIDDNRKTRLLMQVPQHTAANIQQGQTVSLISDYSVDFTIERIYPALNDFRQFVVEAQTEMVLPQFKFDMQIPAEIITRKVEGVIVSPSALFVNFTAPAEVILYPVKDNYAIRTSCKPLMISPDGRAAFSPDDIPEGTLLAAGSYLENVRLPASFAVEVLP